VTLVARLQWVISVMGRRRTSSPATVGDTSSPATVGDTSSPATVGEARLQWVNTVGDMQWVMCRTETALRLTSFAQGAIRLAYVMAYNERVALAASRMAEPTSLRQGFGWQAGLEPRKERNAAPARVSCELF
jgi:hypothetical protein